MVKLRRQTAAALLVSSTAAQQISSGCNQFLVNLDQDSSIKACTTGLLQATAAFNPVLGPASNQASISQVQSTLSTLCSSSTNFCAPATMQAALNMFSGNCSAELAGSNAVPAVVAIFDSMYILSPFLSAICTTDPVSNNACVLAIAGNTASNAASQPSISSSSTAPLGSGNATVSIAGTANVGSANGTAVRLAARAFDVATFANAALSPANLYVVASDIVASANKRYKRQAPSPSSSSRSSRSSARASASASATAPAATNAARDIIDASTFPNVTTFNNAYLPFLFLNPAMKSSQLCNTCSKNVVAAYVAWENRQPYSMGLANSPLLSIQKGLWQAMGATCGGGFLTSVNVIAGQNSFVTSSASTLAFSSTQQQLVALSTALTLFLGLL